MFSAKVSFLAFVLSFFCLSADAQDFVYTQYQAAPLYYNPALTGADAGLHTYSLGRLQWMNLPVSSKSFNFSGDFGQRKIPGIGGIGVFLNGGTQSGYIDNLQVGLSFSARIKFSKNFFTQIGIAGSVIMRKINWDDFVYAGNLDPRYGNIYPDPGSPPDENKKTVGDFGAGLLFQFISNDGHIKGNAGAAADHIFEPDISFLSGSTSPYSRKWVAHTDFSITTKECSTCNLHAPGFAEPLQINPGALFQSQGNFRTIQTGCDITKINIIAGLWYRHTFNQSYTGDVYSAKCGFRIPFSKESFIRLIDSIDLADQDFSASPVLAHEVSMTLFFGSFKKHQE